MTEGSSIDMILMNIKGINKTDQRLTIISKNDPKLTETMPLLTHWEVFAHKNTVISSCRVPRHQCDKPAQNSPKIKVIPGCSQAPSARWLMMCCDSNDDIQNDKQIIMNIGRDMGDM
jgi:hypothetical protein